MKIINTVTGETVSEITANHSMTLDEAINLVGEIITPENPGDADVLIDGNLYFYDDLAMDFTQEQKQEEKKMNAKEIIESGLYSAAVALMDDEIRERLHNSGDYETEESFLAAYMEAHEAKYGVAFCI